MEGYVYVAEDVEVSSSPPITWMTEYTVRCWLEGIWDSQESGLTRPEYGIENMAMSAVEMGFVARYTEDLHPRDTIRKYPPRETKCSIEEFRHAGIDGIRYDTTAPGKRATLEEEDDFLLRVWTRAVEIWRFGKASEGLDNRSFCSCNVCRGDVRSPLPDCERTRGL